MNTDRIVASLAYLNMKKDFLMTGFRVVEFAAIVATQFGCRVSPTISTEPAKNSDNSSEIDPTATAEIAKITTGELRIVKDVETKDKLISSLPVNKPEAQGDLDVFTIKVGDKDVPVIMYPILADTYVKSVSPTGTENNTLQSVALYTEFVDVDGNKSWVRLTAVNPDPKVQATVWMYDPKGLPGPNETVDMSRAVLGYAFDETRDMAIGIKFQPLFIQPDYIEGYNYKEPVDVLIVGEIPAGMKVQARLAEPESPTASFERMEAEYIETLSPEQSALYEQYGSKDRTSEGLVRQFLTHPDLSTYLAYVDAKPDSKDLGEVVAVWNPEQKKSNPALLVENNLFVNENSASEIIWNPEMNRMDAKQTMSDYMKYVRAQMCAKSNNIDLPNTLGDALSDPNAIKFLEVGCTVNLRAVRENGKLSFTVQEQSMFVSGQTGIVIKFVSEEEDNMRLVGKKDGYFGLKFSQHNNLITAAYFNVGQDLLIQYPEHLSKLFSERIAVLMKNILGRSSKSGDDITQDEVTMTTIHNDVNFETKPLVIFSKTR